MDINELLSKLQNRVERLTQLKLECIDIGEELLIDDEISKSQAIIAEISTQQCESLDENLILQNTQQSLELEVYRTKSLIVQKLETPNKLREDLVINYNMALEKYNLLTNLLVNG